MAKKQRNLLVEQTLAYNNTSREPQSLTSLGSKVKRVYKMRFYRELGLKIVLVLWGGGGCCKISTTRGSIYHTISIYAIVVPLLRQVINYLIIN